MVGKYLARSGLVMMAILAAAVALYSLRYYGALVDGWLDVDLKIRAIIEHVPIQALTHMLIAPVALLLGPFQFFPRLRAKYPQAHRWSGRVYVAACVVAGTGGLATSPSASGGPVAGLGFGILAVLWVGTTLGAWRAAVQRQFALHRLLMRWIPELFGDVGMARLYLLDSERDRRGALFGDGGIAPSGGARDGLISGAGNTEYEGFGVMAGLPARHCFTPQCSTLHRQPAGH